MKPILKILLLFFCLPTFAQQNLATILEKYKGIGMSVAVVKNNKIIHQEAVGLKNLESKTPLNTSDLFRIASISKSFTSTAIMQLIEQGKLTLSTDISDVIGFQIRNPKFPEKIITVEMLLSHTSSINDSQGYFELDVIHPEKNKDYPKAYNSYAPGSQYQYCNLNFNILGAVIERLSGERFDQYIVKHILNPLAIYGGYCIDSLDKSKFVSLYNYEVGYQESVAAYNPRTEEIRNYVMGYSTPLFSPTGGMKISSEGLAKYMIMHMNYGKANGKRIIPKKLSKRMQTPISTPENYGLALRTSTQLIDGVNLVGHTGSAYGLYSSMFFHPKKKYGFVAITNGCQNCYSEPFNKMLKEAINYLYAEYVK